MFYPYLLRINKGRSINDLGGARAKAGEKNSTATCPGKKTQLNNPEEIKNSTQQPGRKKNNHGLYAGLRCPEHGHT